jgi:hypothetical protein
MACACNRRFTGSPHRINSAWQSEHRNVRADVHPARSQRMAARAVVGPIKRAWRLGVSRCEVLRVSSAWGGSAGCPTSASEIARLHDRATMGAYRGDGPANRLREPKSALVAPGTDGVQIDHWAGRVVLLRLIRSRGRWLLGAWSCREDLNRVHGWALRSVETRAAIRVWLLDGAPSVCSCLNSTVGQGASALTSPLLATFSPMLRRGFTVSDAAATRLAS